MGDFALQARRRTLFVLGGLVFLGLGLLVRLLDLQVFRRDFLVAKAQEFISVEKATLARRGHIFDTRGRVLAVNEKGYILWVRGPDMRAGLNDLSPEAVFMLGELATWPAPATVATYLSGRGTGNIVWTRWVAQTDVDKLLKIMEVKEERLEGIELQGGVYLEIEPRRTYPYANLFGYTVGYLHGESPPDDREVTAYTATLGVEEQYDDLLKGTDGLMRIERDAKDFRIPIGKYEEYPAQDGADITLTLDLNIQYQAQRLLARAIKQPDVEARRGDVIVMDPRSGAILAMVSLPSFDPNQVTACANDERCRELLSVNPAIAGNYEPGSTMKILTMAIALEEAVIRPEASFECTGEVVAAGVYFHNWNQMAHGRETMAEILLHSCNIGAATVNLRVGSEAYYRHLETLGFGQPTGVDLPGEGQGFYLIPGDEGWSEANLATNAFGQGIAVTPLQLLATVSAVANGGNLLTPHVVRAVERNGVVTPTVPILRGRVFRQETCREVTQMLAGIGAIKGEDGGPLVPGYRVALKTGTAQIPIEGDIGYEPHRTIASAIGYAPADDPHFVILVRIEGNSVIWGEEVAVPVVRELVRYLLTYLQIPPTEEVKSGEP